MKVGLVCPYDMGSNGGVQDQIVRLQGWLADAGHESKIIGPGESNLPGFVSTGPVRVVSANGSDTPVSLSRGVSRIVVDALREVDVAHIHEPLMPMVSLAALRKATVPMVGTFHSDTTKAVEWVYKLGRPLTMRWFDRLDVITAVSPVSARNVENTGRVKIIPNGIDVAMYAPTTKVPQSVVFLGRDNPRKGRSVLLEAWPTVLEQHPNANLVVVGAGEPDDDVPGVVFAGEVSEQEKRTQLARSSIYCAPNLSGESFGIVVLEGMAAGCAVVASGLPAFVRVAGDAGRYTPPGDSAGLAATLIELLGDNALVQSMGDSALQNARQYSGDVVAAAYVDAYREAIATRRS